MQQSTLLSLLGSLQSYRETQDQKNRSSQRYSTVLIPSLEPKKRTELWNTLIPETFQDEARKFFNSIMTSKGVSVFDRHKVKIEHDTLFLSHIINTSRVKELPLITNKKLALMRNMIYLYLNFNKEADYHNGWTFISYVILALEATEEENFVFFSYIIQNILSGFFLTFGNFEKKLEMIANLYLLVESKHFKFLSTLNPTTHKGVKTLPQYSQIQGKKKTNFFSFPKIFRTKNNNPGTTAIPNQRTSIDNLPSPSSPRVKFPQDILPMSSEYINDPALFSLMRSTSEIWFGLLFANILHLKECLELWDHFLIHGTGFLYQFSLSVLNSLDNKLVEVIKQERQRLNNLKVEDTPLSSFLICCALKKVLMTPLSREEFQNVLTAAKDLVIENYVKEKSLSSSKKIIQIITHTPFERLQYLAQTKKELNALLPLSKKVVCDILEHIDELDQEELKVEDIVTILEMEGIFSPNLALKIFVLIDFEMKGFLEKKELKTFFILLTDSTENKIFLFWKETGNQSQLSISADEGIKLLQMIERFISPYSIEVDDEVAKIYEAWIQAIPGNITPLKSFIHFVQTSPVCKLLRTSLEIIDGHVSVETKKNLSKQRICGTNEKIDQTNEELDSMDFSILNDSALSVKGEESLSDHLDFIESKREGDINAYSKTEVKRVEVPSMDPHTLVSSARERLLPRSISFSKIKSSIPSSVMTENFNIQNNNLSPTNH